MNGIGHSLYRSTAAPGTFVFSMTIQAWKNCLGLPGALGEGDGHTLVAARLADLYSTLVQCVQNVQVVQSDSGFSQR